MESLNPTSSSPALPLQAPQAMPQQMPANAGIELNDIHLPAQINDFPIALGWWLLAAIIIGVIILAAVKYRAYIKLRISQKQAISQLQNSPNIDHTIKVLKWAAIQYFPRNQIAHLYGEQFQSFLSNQLTGNQQLSFNELSSPAFENLYQNESPKGIAEQLNQASLLWLKNALPPRKNRSLGVNS